MQIATRKWSQYAQRVGEVCHYCGCQLDAGSFSLDHRIPRCRGGADAWWNIVACCRRCNAAKGPLTEREFREVQRDDQARKRMVRSTHATLAARRAAADSEAVA